MISGTVFGVLVGWIIGSQQARPAAPGLPSAPSAATAAPSSDAPPPLDVQRAATLERTAQAEPSNSLVRMELANLYYDAQRFDLAATWYEAVLKLDPHNVNASTDLAVCYHYQGEGTRALAQIDRSLTIDPKHTKTLLNQGIIRFQLKDVDGAVKSWQRIIDIAPGSEDAKRAQMGLDGINGSRGGRS
jgi:cytochrome c-type biogenesis protein CcmH/NrfG